MASMYKDFLKENGIVVNGKYNVSAARQKRDVIEKFFKANCNVEYDLTYGEMVYWLYNGLTNYPKQCLECGKQITYFRSFNDPYPRSFCSKSCSVKNQLVQAKKRKTLLDKFGVDHQMKANDVKEKIKKTNIDRYGCENVFQNENIKEKIKNQLIEKYGVDNPSQLNEVKEKKKQTSLDNWNVEYPSQNESIKKKIASTLRENHGDKVGANSDKFKETCQCRYGVSNPKMVDSIAKKAGKTYSDNYIKSIHGQETYDYLHNQDKFEKDVTSKGVPEVSRLKSIPIGLIYKFSNLYNLEYYYVDYQTEQIVKNFLDEQGYDYERNTRKIIGPKELDFYIPEFNLAIECNGNFFHSELYRNSEYHLNKLKQCTDKGIKLLQFFEDELLEKSNICFDIIGSNFTNFHKERKYARKLKLTQIDDNRVVHSFMNENHLQGATRYSVAYGLFEGDELLCCMTFAKSRFNKKVNTYEIVRFASKIHHQIVGGASRILTRFEKDFDNPSIITYSDLRFSLGKTYETIGFTYSHSSQPGYFYILLNKALHRHNRIKFQKHKLKDKLETFDPKLTEWENMQNNNYTRIWDCGHKVWIKN